MNSQDFSFENLEDFDNHRQITFLKDNAGLKGFIVIHRGGTIRPAFGATRLWSYPAELDALREALKLSRMMSYKSAMANLNYGGAKAVLINDGKLAGKKRSKLLKHYSQRVNYLSGHFITGADVGIDDRDLKSMSEESPYIVGLQSDPVKYTALGVYYSIQACLKEIFGQDSFKGKTFAIQGLGKTGVALLRLIYGQAKKIYVTDIDSSKIRWVKEHFPKVEVVDFSQIDKLLVDVFCPCALGNAINLDNVSALRCKMIVGSANLQLENSQIGELLHKLGILYAPDYVVNAGGLIAVVDEFEKKDSDEERVTKKVVGIRNSLKSIIGRSKKENRATNLVADEMAEKIFNKLS